MKASRQRLLWIALALSLAMNLSLLVGVFYADHAMQKPPRGEALIVKLGEQLDLSAEQQNELSAIRGSVVDRFAAQEQQGKDWGHLVAAIMRQPTFEGGDLKLSLVEREAGRVDFFIATMARLYDFTSQLTPDARRNFLSELEDDASFLRRLFGPSRKDRKG